MTISVEGEGGGGGKGEQEEGVGEDESLLVNVLNLGEGRSVAEEKEEGIVRAVRIAKAFHLLICRQN